MKIAELVDELADSFARSGIEDPRGDARALVAFGLGKAPIFVRTHAADSVEEPDLIKIRACQTERLSRRPVSKIIGSRGFWRLDFKTTEDVLDPRPDSETLIEQVLTAKPDKSAALKILDLGTGSGCLALALLSEYPKAVAIGTDQSDKALQIAAENAKLNGISARFNPVFADWTAENWDAALPAPFDIIISNPPYIRDDEAPALSPEVRDHDPARALFGGTDGLDPYRILLPALNRLLSPDGIAVFEFGKGQQDAVRAIGEQSGLKFVKFGTDYGQIVRCALFSKGDV